MSLFDLVCNPAAAARWRLSRIRAAKSTQAEGIPKVHASENTTGVDPLNELVMVDAFTQRKHQEQQQPPGVL